MPAVNGVSWFEIGTDDPERAERFYADVFGWTVSADDPASPDPTYRIITTGDGEGLRGGLVDTGGSVPNYAVFSVLVDDVAAACRRIEQAGGKIDRGPKVDGNGVTLAHVLDPDGNHVEVYALPSRPA